MEFSSHPDTNFPTRAPVNQNERRVDALSVSVIIPHFDDLHNLGRCLELLAAQTMCRGAFEIVVADNNSRCGISAVEEVCAGQARVVPAPIQGAAEARNAGVRASRGHILAFIDSDCRPSPEWLERGTQALAGADMVGGRVDVDVLDEANLTAVEAFEKVFAFNFKRYIEKENFSGSGNMFIPRATFDKVGGFRSGVAEDRDWGQRAVALGYRWGYEPRASVSHPARRDWPELKRKWRRATEEAYSGMRQKPFGKLRWVMRSWLILLSPFYHAMTVLGSSKLNRHYTKSKAIGVLFRIRWWRFRQCYIVLFEAR